MRRGTRAAGFACTLISVAACVAPASEPAAPRIALGGDSPLVAAFERVSYDTGIPAELLATLAYVETRLEHVSPETHHVHGAPAYGMFALSPGDLAAGARLAGVTDDAARTDPIASLRAGAALLRAQAPDAVTVDDFLVELAPALRSEVTALLTRGIDARDPAGLAVVIAARGGRETPGFGVATQALGYGDAEWIPANSANYQVANRTVGNIDHVVIHTTQGGYSGTLSWFKDPSAQVSAHYVLRSSDGHVAQMVDEKNVAWHDKCFNTSTVGIEHEGYVEKPDLWYTDAMYTASAKLTSYLCDKYGIPKELGPIVGHGDAPDCSDHTDPGPGWDWDYYIDLVKTGGNGTFRATDIVVDAPPALVAGEHATVTVTLTNTGLSQWDLDTTRIGTAAPQDRDSEFFVDGDWIAPNRATGLDAVVRAGETGTFTFDIVAPEVREPTMFDETFQLVQEGVTWFGPDIHVLIQVSPSSGGGCSTSTGGSGCGMFALGALALVLRRRRLARARAGARRVR